MDNSCISALLSQELPRNISDNKINQRQSCELSPHLLQHVSPIPSLTADKMTCGRDSMSSTILRTNDLVFDSEVICTTSRSSCSVEPIISSLATLQITMDAKKTAANPTSSSFAPHLTNFSCFNSNSSSHSSSTQEFPQNSTQSLEWLYHGHIGEENDQNCLSCDIVRMSLQRVSDCSKAENRQGLFFTLSSLVSSSRKSTRHGLLKLGYQKGVWPSSVSNQVQPTAFLPTSSALSSFPYQPALYLSIPNRSNKTSSSQNRPQLFKKLFAYRLQRDRGFRERFRAKFDPRMNKLTRCMIAMRITPEKEVKSLTMPTDGRNNLRQFVKETRHRRRYL
ncbi:hypothetical protein EmuJ_001080200 [Echinococcus multilocularis]|uniref:Uncharacterized protein n=1 Tax=Echinococcus multilocularis TaxID=6211 RepID=A0A068YEV9_ECHMU|nr:hypothetical protein EmuJ_001080200 [Echinococcus multilocularis]